MIERLKLWVPARVVNPAPAARVVNPAPAARAAKPQWYRLPG
jgi:hypothetical protein